MPTYDYKCTMCTIVIEQFHGMNDTPTIKCTKCKIDMKKQIGKGSGVIYKGSGFYSTDY